MKRYLVFANIYYYPSGGWGDYEGTYDTLEEARAAAKAARMSEWWQIVDTTTLEVVERS